MSRIELEIIRLQVLGDNVHQEDVDLVYGTYSNSHTFVLGDDSADWNVNQTQNCNDQTVCRLTAGDNHDEVTPNTLNGWISNTKSVFFQLGDSDYKLEFEKE